MKYAKSLLDFGVTRQHWIEQQLTVNFKLKKQNLCTAKI